MALSTNSTVQPPFSSVVILPSYGVNICTITWTLEPEYLNSDLYCINVYKSRDGYTDWFKVNTDPISPESGTINVDGKINGADMQYVDTAFHNRNQVFIWHYILELFQISHDSDGNPVYTSICKTAPIGLYESISSAEFSTLRAMLRNELLSKDSIDVLICRPKGFRGHVPYNDRPTPTIDYLSQEQIGVATDERALGQIYLGGYSTPVKTQIVINEVKNEHIDDAAGNGTMTKRRLAFTGYSYPRLIKGDMIVFPQTDDRYFFDTYVKENLFKGLFPFMYQGIMTLIPRNDIAYRIKLRDMERCSI